MASIVPQFVRVLPLQAATGWRTHAGELGLYLGFYILYLLLKEFAPGGEMQALTNADLVISAQSALGLFLEPSLQGWAMDSAQPLVVLLNWVYVLTYWPVILTAALVLYCARRPVYLRYRNLIVAHLVLALILFVAFPLAPPYKTVYLVDTIQLYGPAFYGSPTMAHFYNTNAAMPSLHFSWTCIIAWMFVKELGGWRRYAVLGYPLLTLAAILVTGNHYLLDAVAGGCLIPVAMFATRLVERLSRWPRKRGPQIEASRLSST